MIRRVNVAPRLLVVMGAALACTEARPLRPPFDEEMRDAQAADVTTLAHETLAHDSLAHQRVPEESGFTGSLGFLDRGPSDSRFGKSPPHSVLHIGDSLVGFRGGLSKALERRFHRLGAHFASDAWGGVGIAQFERSTRLEEWLAKSKPDLILFSLGMNNVDAPHPESLGPAIRSIVKRIGRRACVFVGPPTTRPDTGIVETLKHSVAPCRYIDSRGLEIERVDGLHPSDRGGEIWAEGIWLRLEESFPAPAAGIKVE